MKRSPSTRITHRALTLSMLLGAIASPVGTVLADPLNPLDFPSLGTQTIGAGIYTLNTDTLTFGPFAGMISNAGGGLGIAVFNFDFLTVDAGAVINVVGSRPVALLAVGNIVFEGMFNANGGNGGPGGLPDGGISVAGGGNGGVGGSGEPIGVGGHGAGVGGGHGGSHGGNSGTPGMGGGGGFGGAGSSGTNQPFSINGVGGTAYGNLLLRLDAGSGGGGSSAIGGGGAGGGAIEFGALSGVTLSGTINANGGQGGWGGGGGSGGGVLIHAQNVSVSGTLRASGGGGGSSSPFGVGGGGGGGRFATISVNSVNTGGVSVLGGNGNNGTITTAHGILTATALDFGPVRVGTSKTAFMGIQNTGDADTSINGRFPQPAGGSVFSRIGNGIFSALHQNRFTANPYTFTPTALGDAGQPLSFLSDGSDAPVDLLGIGVGPLAVANVAFGSTIDFRMTEAANVASAPLTFSNATTSNPFLPGTLIRLTLESYSITGPDADFFSLGGFSPGQTLDAGDLAAMQVQFIPNGATGPKTATLTIQSDQGAALGAAGETFSFTLNGAATVPEPGACALIVSVLVCFGAGRRKGRRVAR